MLLYNIGVVKGSLEEGFFFFFFEVAEFVKIMRATYWICTIILLSTKYNEKMLNLGLPNYEPQWDRFGASCIDHDKRLWNGKLRELHSSFNNIISTDRSNCYKPCVCVCIHQEIFFGIQTRPLWFLPCLSNSLFLNHQRQPIGGGSKANSLLKNRKVSPWSYHKKSS